jgi:hypothetical protein
MAVDRLDRAGVYFGTRSGKLYGSPDEGRTWALVREGLPPVVCVKAGIADNVKARRAAGAKSRRTRKAA